MRHHPHRTQVYVPRRDTRGHVVGYELVGFLGIGNPIKAISNVAKKSLTSFANPLGMAGGLASGLGIKIPGVDKIEALAAKGSKVALNVATHPALKPIAGGLAVVCPPIGAPMVATIAAAEIAKKITAAANGLDPKKRKAAVNVVKRTAALSKAGNTGARRALAMMVNAKKQMNKTATVRGKVAATPSGPAINGALVTRINGRPVVLRGTFVQAG